MFLTQSEFLFLVLGTVVTLAIISEHYLRQRRRDTYLQAIEQALALTRDDQSLAWPPGTIPVLWVTSAYETASCGCAFLNGELAYRCVDCSDVTEVIDTELDGWVSYWADQQRKEGR